jgi:CubicO group peptidase (beta-lactamase class C family)
MMYEDVRRQEQEERLRNDHGHADAAIRPVNTSGLISICDPRRLEAVVADVLTPTGPGAAVGISAQGQAVLRRGFGLLRQGLAQPLGSDTPMRIGSTTKQFTALAAMLLHEDGLLDLDAPIGDYLPGLNRTNGSAAINQLLTNTSGLSDTFSFKLEFAGIETPPIDSGALLGLYSRVTHRNSPPGATWRYNNGGWLLLGAIIEQLSTYPLEQFFADRIFAPLGMASSLFCRFDHDLPPDAATAHMRVRDGQFVHADYGMDNFAAAGAIVSTVDDMLRWLAHIDAPVIGSPESWRRILTPHRLPNGISTGYGFGIFNTRYRDLEVIHHAGGGCGCNAQALKVPAAGLDIVVMANRDDVSSSLIVRRLLDAILPAPLPATGRPARVEASGAFRSARTGRVVTLESAGDRTTICFGEADQPLDETENGWLEPAPEKRYLQRRLRIEPQPADPPMLRLSDFGHPDELLPDTRPMPDPGRIAGHYSHSAAGILATIIAEPSGLRMETVTPMGTASFSVDHVSGHVFRTRSLGLRSEYGGLIDFSDTLDGFAYTTAFLDRLPFVRCDEAPAA